MKKSELNKIIKTSLGLDEEKEIIGESYVASPKSFDLNTDKLSQKTKTAHKELYDKYIKTFNRVSAELDTADRSESNPNHSKYRSLKIDEAYNLNAIYLHELYFANIADPASEVSMDSLTFMRLARDFGTFDDWQKDFIACSQAARSGWAVCSFNPYLQRYHNFLVDLDNVQIPVGAYPVIVLDVWEHAYYKDYLVNKRGYIFNMMKEFNWDIIEERFKRAEGFAKALR